MCSVFIMGKARLAPLKPTFSTLELTAAVVAAASIDSTSVLKYIKKTRPPEGVLTPSQKPLSWKKSSSEIQYVNTFMQLCRPCFQGTWSRVILKGWISGPQFLMMPEKQCPTNPDNLREQPKQDDLKVKACILANTVCAKEVSGRRGKRSSIHCWLIQGQMRENRRILWRKSCRVSRVYSMFLSVWRS